MEEIYKTECEDLVELNGIEVVNMKDMIDLYDVMAFHPSLYVSGIDRETKIIMISSLF